ncbi:peptidylprolyl isomerase [Polaribacter batillariae]|uniref:Peptidylprolyl isomerase n=1 Tax=Polaribacter batillariae TaxID=2808900 RepID=A0ABX7SUC3_9FLAO|nr:peptidylprolyl isomerase [Polaribacter batillariae]QTD37832.1 peptidylprolyl isomerase [Polaribacter batillariae]
MNKIKNIFALLILAVVILNSCDDNRRGIVDPFADVNYEQLAISDNDSIEKFLKTHYYDENLDLIKELSDGKTSILEDDRLIINELTENDIKYKLYTLVTKQGVPSNDKGFPTFIDSVFTNYTGILLLNNTIDRDAFDTGQAAWLTNTIRGWAKGFTHFKGGDNITDNGPITYENTGKGYIFIPSGLAYPSINYVIGRPINERPYDRILVFKVELLDFIKDTDHDNDGTPSVKEDANGDEDVTNDFSDPDKPNVPDYLNPDIK